MLPVRKWAAFAVLALCPLPLFAQAPEGWRFGTAVGAQRYSSNVEALSGLGVQASVGRWLMPRLGVGFAFDYSALPFRQRVNAISNTRESNLFGAALLFELEAMPAYAAVNPYLKLGGGLESMQVGSSSRQIYAAGIAGGGVRLKLLPQIALHLHGDYHLMDTRSLQGFAPNQPPQGYFTARAGLTFFTRKEATPDEGLLNEAAEIEEIRDEEPPANQTAAEPPAEQGASMALAAGQNQTEDFSFEDEFEGEEETPPQEPPLVSDQQEDHSSPSSEPAPESFLPSADASFDFSTLEERLQALESGEADSAPTLSEDDGGEDAESDAGPEDFTALEARLQQLEQEYDAAPEKTEAAAAREDFPAPENRADPRAAGAFEQHLDELASQHETPAPAPAGAGENAFLEIEEEEAAGDFTALEERMALLESEPAANHAAPDNSNSGAAEALAPAGNGLVEKNTSLAIALPAPKPAPPRSFAQDYESALHSFYLGDYSEAMYKLALLAEQYPNHTLASNCHYWLGEAQLQTNNVQEAIASFTKVLNSEKSLKKDNALLMLGRCYMILKRPNDARAAFDRVIAEYPGSEAVGKARQYLGQL